MTKCLIGMGVRSWLLPLRSTSGAKDKTWPRLSWPPTFTVYDIRACEQLGCVHQLAHCMKFERLWSTYEQFCDAVDAAGPDGLSLREKDRYLWGRSSASQLEQDIARCFISPDKPSWVAQFTLTALSRATFLTKERASRPILKSRASGGQKSENILNYGFQKKAL